MPAEGFVDFTNFLVLVSKFKREGDSEEEILEAFRVFDPQFTGVISVTEFRQVMMNYGERLTEQEVDNLVALADVDRKGEIRYMGRLTSSISR
jgi:Ca2+-binding EF-hand superfamily protein